MSRNDEIASDVERDAQSTDSVYDFLYHDARRIGSFLAQIDPSGHLTSLKQIDSAESGSGMRSSANVSGNAVVARAGAAMEDQRTAVERESLERTYDPLWTNALALLDMLDEREMIRRGLIASRIGYFVKVSGSLSVTDLTLWRGLWSMPALKEAFIEGAVKRQPLAISSQNRTERRKARGKEGPSSKSTLESQMEAGLAMVGMLPHTIQARMFSNDGTSAWCSLREDGLVVSASDLTLKHGVTISGQWTMVGVLDAVPDADGPQGNGGLPNLGASPLSELMQTLTPAFRTILGRPTQDYGAGHCECQRWR